MKSIYFLSTFCLLCSCTSLKKTIKCNGIQNDPIQIAILDFSKACSIYEEDSVFLIKKFTLSKYDSIVLVSVTRNFTKMIVRADTKVGSKGKIASRYFQKTANYFIGGMTMYCLPMRHCKYFVSIIFYLTMMENL